MGTWFEQLFGFAETDYAATQARFRFEGTTLRSEANARTFEAGRFSTPSLAELRARCAAADLPPGAPRLTHVAIGDVLALHADPENRGAVFQAASQFNCLEFADPREVPEDGVTQYADDATQGPACALAAAAATVVRNYFVPVGDQIGQTRQRQLNNLDALQAHLGDPGAYFDVRNGYTWSDPQRLAALAEAMAAHPRDQLRGLVKIGLHADVGVTFAERYVEPPAPTTVTQAFCSALSCGYSGMALEHWAPLATLVLDAAYEATLRVAALKRRAASDPVPVVWLTLLGGGAFGNRKAWIAAAIARALSRVRDLGLDVRVAHYRRIHDEIVDEIGNALATVDHPTSSES